MKVRNANTDQINVVIQVPARSKPIKYQIDKASGALFVESFLPQNMNYPCNYGFIPQTLSEKANPIVALVLSPIPLNQGCIIHSRPIGMLSIKTPEKSLSHIVAVPIKSLTHAYDHIDTIEDLPILLLQQMTDFFIHFDGIDLKMGTNQMWVNKDLAKNEIQMGLKRFENSVEEITNTVSLA